MADFDPFTHPEFIQDTWRSRQIQQLQAYYDSKQYEGRADWWTGKKKGNGEEEVPLRERKPCVIYELPKACVLQVVRFLFGDGKFPQLKVEPVEKADAAQLALSPEDAIKLQTWLAEFVERSKLKPRMRALAKRGIGMKTAVAVLSLKRGEFRIQMPRAQDCWAKFVDDDPELDVVRLVWSYEYEREIADSQGRPKTVRFRFRREWDERNLYVYEDVEVKTGQVLTWGAPQTKPHGFTFCPVVWIPNQIDESSSGMDGQGLYDGLEDEFDALNFAYSQRHRGIHYWGSPQPYETGVTPEDSPHADGRVANPQPSVSQTQYVSEAAKEFAIAHPEVTAEAQPARKISPDTIWSYPPAERPGDTVTVGLLEASGSAFEAGTNHINDIRSRLLEQMGVVLTSMADTVSRVTTGGQMSAKFLALAHAPLLNLTSELRQAWWSFGLSKILTMSLRMVAELKGEGVLVPGSIDVAKLLSTHHIEVASSTGGQTQTVFLPPKITPLWGAFFDPSTAEVKDTVGAAAQARKGLLVTAETATRFIADEFGIDDVDKELQELEAEQAEQDAKDKAEADERMKVLAQGQQAQQGPPGQKPATTQPKPQPKPTPAKAADNAKPKTKAGKDAA